ncbi:ATP-binding cassette domain-containing protein, partial [Bradyrhizobium ottawaense]|uniref:ATP-binding cassette domain-containing protein n=1 Tax=Bradyrhizobium ottawaense TaxID=931866 RepID=UPI0030C74E5A
SGEREKTPLLLIEKLVKEYPRQGATATLGKLFGRKPPLEPDVFRAVDGISFSIGHGESVGLVGESGCGTTMPSRAVLQLLPKKQTPTDRVMLDGHDLVRLDAE